MLRRIGSGFGWIVGDVWMMGLERRVGLGLGEFRYCKTDTDVSCRSG